MESRMAVWAFGMLFFTLVGGQYGGVAAAAGSRSTGSRKCRFPAIFNFGDSNSDTGTASAALYKILLPNGMSFRGNDSNRASDGRLVIDYIAENLGLPYLDAPLDSIGTSFKYGANFATGGAKITPVVIQGATPPIHLDVQVSQFLQFKSRTIVESKQRINNIAGWHSEKNGLFVNNLPKPEVFSKALYTTDIGQNDINSHLDNSSIAAIADQFSYSIQRLLREGAKFFWVHNSGPVGCLPYSVNNCPQNKTECSLDQNGCVKQLNELTQEFNKQLKDRVYKLRAQYPDAAITYVDMYSAKHELMTNGAKYGFQDPFKPCAGYGSVCTDPSKYVSWDTIHNTQAANHFLANIILNGSMSDPPIPVSGACCKR